MRYTTTNTVINIDPITQEQWKARRLHRQTLARQRQIKREKDKTMAILLKILAGFIVLVGLMLLSTFFIGE